MKKRYDRRMLSAFSAALAEKELAAQFTISKRGLQDLLQMDDWLTRFAALERNSGRYCCRGYAGAAFASTRSRLVGFLLPFCRGQTLPEFRICCAAAKIRRRRIVLAYIDAGFI